MNGVDQTRRELRTKLSSIEKKTKVVDVVIPDAVDANADAQGTIRRTAENGVLIDKIGLCFEAAKP